MAGEVAGAAVCRGSPGSQVSRASPEVQVGVEEQAGLET